MDPRLVQQWMDEGKLPNMQKLAKRGGGVHPLETTHSPESPTAWASFATGVNAGKHNIYDFLVRDTRTYLPDLGMVHREPPRFILNYIPIARRSITSIRGGTSFWVTAGRGRRALEHADRAGHVPARGRAQRRAALRPAAARHPRHDGHVLLLRHGPEPLRGRQHRVRRHPQAAGLRRRRRRRPSSSGRRTRSSGSSCASCARAGAARAKPTRCGSPSSRRARTCGCR